MFKKSVEQKKQLGGDSSFVAPEAYYAFQMDLMFFAGLNNQNVEVVMACIDILVSMM